MAVLMPSEVSSYGRQRQRSEPGRKQQPPSPTETAWRREDEGHRRRQDSDGGQTRRPPPWSVSYTHAEITGRMALH